MPIEIKELVIRASVEREQSYGRTTIPASDSSAQVWALRERIDELVRMINERNER